MKLKRIPTPLLWAISGCFALLFVGGVLDYLGYGERVNKVASLLVECVLIVMAFFAALAMANLAHALREVAHTAKQSKNGKITIDINLRHGDDFDEDEPWKRSAWMDPEKEDDEEDEEDQN